MRYTRKIMTAPLVKGRQTIRKDTRLCSLGAAWTTNCCQQSVHRKSLKSPMTSLEEIDHGLSSLVLYNMAGGGNPLNGADLQEVYANLRPNLLLSLIRDIPPPYIRRMAVDMHSGLLFPNDWRMYAHFMGIPNSEIDAVEVAATACREVPMYLVMATLMSDRSVVDLIDGLFQLQRDDILRFFLQYAQHIATNLHNGD